MDMFNKSLFILCLNFTSCVGLLGAFGQNNPTTPNRPSEVGANNMNTQFVIDGLEVNQIQSPTTPNPHEQRKMDAMRQKLQESRPNIEAMLARMIQRGQADNSKIRAQQQVIVAQVIRQRLELTPVSLPSTDRLDALGREIEKNSKFYDQVVEALENAGLWVPGFQNINFAK